jgi:hypothetical protein
MNLEDYKNSPLHFPERALILELKVYKNFIFL